MSATIKNSKLLKCSPSRPTDWIIRTSTVLCADRQSKQ